jgi:hypothetical protein
VTRHGRSAGATRQLHLTLQRIGAGVMFTVLMALGNAVVCLPPTSRWRPCDLRRALARWRWAHLRTAHDGFQIRLACSGAVAVFHAVRNGGGAQRKLELRTPRAVQLPRLPGALVFVHSGQTTTWMWQQQGESTTATTVMSECHLLSASALLVCCKGVGHNLCTASVQLHPIRRCTAGSSLALPASHQARGPLMRPCQSDSSHRTLANNGPLLLPRQQDNSHLYRE